jgi:Tfp pilus assembly PilM family ATPase
MASVSGVIDQLRGLDFERALGLRPEYPRLGLELERHSMALVRIKKKKRKGRPQLESFRVQPLDEAGVPATISDGELKGQEKLTEMMGKLFESSGVRPGKLSLVLPDNLAKLTLLTLPERPPSRRQLEEVIRFKVRRGVPFRMADAVMSYQLLPGEGKGVSILVALLRRALVERYEHALEALGARPGLVDLCTPNLLNLCRDRMEAAGAEGDVALLNCAGNYFSLAIVRNSRLVFMRCKTYSMSEGEPRPVNGLLARELGYSLSYYEEKLEGEGIRNLLVRSVTTPFDELRPDLEALRAERVELLDPAAAVETEDGTGFEPELAQRLAPALGAVLGRL